MLVCGVVPVVVVAAHLKGISSTTNKNKKKIPYLTLIIRPCGPCSARVRADGIIFSSAPPVGFFITRSLLMLLPISVAASAALSFSTSDVLTTTTDSFFSDDAIDGSSDGDDDPTDGGRGVVDLLVVNMHQSPTAAVGHYNKIGGKVGRCSKKITSKPI